MCYFVEAGNVISILISSHFLKMPSLVSVDGLQNVCVCVCVCACVRVCVTNYICAEG